MPDESTPRRPRSQTVSEFVRDIKETADRLEADGIGRGEAKLLSTALRELRYAFKVFSQYRGKRKVTVFGSARTKPDHPTYQLAVEFSRQMAALDYITVTGAGGGIMEAGHVGAGRDMSLGLNILLPFEQSANPVMTGSDRLMTMRYFFTRKLMFVKETDAVVLFPGGFGTHDEGFEALTLIQTGKSHIFPVVMVDQPGGTYWKRFNDFIEHELLGNKLISPADMGLYKVCLSVEEAVQEVTNFYRVYHSMRYVRKDLMMRFIKPISDTTLAYVNLNYKDIIWEGDIARSEADPMEANEPHLASLFRLRFKFDRHGHARLRHMIDYINEAESQPTGAGKMDV
ncbi:LOG family protein [Zavarzinella formosa]|uniref:LOG family protein n=1 Tax=Zavarzinella formosa TaxID=360055 RepID=UPI0002FC591C|nr:LOG family protein [Zavarzinella formosa]